MKRDRYIVIVGWEKFQHYKDRDPVWIKNYTRLTHDDAYIALPLSTRGVLHGLWLEYASAGQVLSESVASRRLVRSESDARHWKRHLERLNHAGFIRFRASRPLAQRKKKRKKDLADDDLKSGDGRSEPLPDMVKTWLERNRPVRGVAR